VVAINFRKYTLVLLFAMTVIGAHLPILRLHGLRLFVAILLVLGFVRAMCKGFRVDYIFRGYIIMAAVWVAWGALGFLWVDDFEAAVKELLDVIFGLSIGVLIFGLVNRNRGMIRSIDWGWIVAYLIASAVALWEIGTGQHLEGSYTEKLPDYALERMWVMSTFGNPNNFAAFLLLCFPFLVHAYSLARHRGAKTLLGIIMLSLPLMLALTGSRGGFGGLLLEIVVLALLGRGRARLWPRLVALALVLSVIYFLISSVGDGQSTISLVEKFNSLTDLESEKSISQRSSLYLNGLYIVANSFGMGVGPHGFERAVLSRDVPYEVLVPNPHNFWLEVATQYGIIVFSLLVYWLSVVARFHLKRLSHEGLANSDGLGKFVLASLAGYSIAAIENSSYIPQPTNWLYLGVLLAVSSPAYSENRRNRKVAFIQDLPAEHACKLRTSQELESR
jgi:uncharacterized membrane protein